MGIFNDTEKKILKLAQDEISPEFTKATVIGLGPAFFLHKPDGSRVISDTLDKEFLKKTFNLIFPVGP